MAWSETNRSPLIRISSWRREGTLCEFRLPDPSCNPYLCLAAILSSGMEGIRQRLNPGQPVNKDILTMSQRERTRLRIQSLPGDLSEAIRAFEKDKFLQNTLGTHISNHIIQAKRKEWQEYIGQVHPWELEPISGLLLTADCGLELPPRRVRTKAERLTLAKDSEKFGDDLHVLVRFRG